MTNAPARLLAEFVGTFALIFIGAGAIMTASELTGGGYSLIGIAAAHGFVLVIFISALGHISGGHFNPAGKKHGLQNPEGPHAGDMENFTVGADGTAKGMIMAKGITMGSEANSVFANGGTALVIHAGPDDMKTDPAGAAGDRIACGTITK